MKNHSVLAVVGLLAVSSVAYAERRQNTLAADVAVRHRRLLVKHRFEFAPLFESTINADFRHILGGGAKLEYHLSDMWSIGAIGVYSTSLDTKLVEKITPTLEPMVDNKTREPSQAEFTDRLNTMPLHGAAYISFTPWYGKLAAFSQAFVAFDFYFQAGVAFASLKSNCPAAVCSDKFPGVSQPDPAGGPEPLPPDLNPNNDPPLNDGSRVGLYLGGGIHVFLNDFLALDMTVRDYAFTDNPSGADFNADLFVSDADNRFLHHLFFGVGLSVMLPTTVKRTP
ncbi:MAG TPA: outer membrane beta-barrel domain-containing protein [Kofleriaceae bacterium]|nr:outer membrane beta-barrel domain-containing protein [Kofleriaceae bacterium]